MKEELTNLFNSFGIIGFTIKEGDVLSIDLVSSEYYLLKYDIHNHECDLITINSLTISFYFLNWPVVLPIDNRDFLYISSDIKTILSSIPQNCYIDYFKDSDIYVRFLFDSTYGFKYKNYNEQLENLFNDLNLSSIIIDIIMDKTVVCTDEDVLTSKRIEAFFNIRKDLIEEIKTSYNMKYFGNIVSAKLYNNRYRLSTTSAQIKDAYLLG